MIKEMKLEQETKATGQPFVPPRHWIGPEELKESYWTDKAVQEKRGQEFFEKPVEWLDRIDSSPEGGFARREFLTVMGASMAMATFACARRPVHKIIPYVVQPEEITPGVPVYYATTSKACSCGCGVLAKTREGRPIKLEGNPDHPINRGSLCARGQASVLSLYDPDRLRSPMSRSRTPGPSGFGQEVTWAAADASITIRLRAAANGGGKVRVLSGPITSPATNRLIKEFVGGFSAGAHVQYEPLALEEIAQGQAQSYGSAVYPSYRFDKAELVVSIGADFLGTWPFSGENSRQWAESRKLDSKNASKAKMSKLVAFESNVSLTGSNADERHPIRPGDEYKVVMALLNEIVGVQGHWQGDSEGKLKETLSGYTADALAESSGIDPQIIRNLAKELGALRGKSVVIAGGISSATADAVGLQVAVNLLNTVLENEGATIDGTVSYAPARSSFSEMNKLVADMNSGDVEVLVVYRNNPLYYLDRSNLDFRDAMTKVPFVVTITDYMDETAQASDFVLPDHHFLENWGDANPRRGIYSLQQPTIAPLYSTRAFEDSLIAWIKGAGLSGNLALRVNDWHGYLMEHWKENFYSGASGSFEQFWEGLLRTGVHETAEGRGEPHARSFRGESLASLPKMGHQGHPEATLVLYANNSVYDGAAANNPWLQELPDPMSSVTWDNYLAISPQLAEKLGIEKDEVVEIRGADFTAQLPAYIQPGMHPNAVAAAVGYGRNAAGRVGTGAGVNVFPFARVYNGRVVYAGFPVQLRNTQQFYRLANTQWHTASENRPVINDITLAEFRKNPAAAQETDPELRLATLPTMWPVHEYKGYRWGMTIDLNSCIGCGACMIACQAENNVAVVGREQVRAGRAMHWIRIDRYFSGSPEKPATFFEPMLCQHCENAPCETVCPVLATVHDDEGLNVQVYNRCVGTRYCQNNCPYKVRRFNFFDHWKAYRGTMNLVWNPDVTVRTRGIMEKCTFCIQRIVAAKDSAKDRGEKVRDGDFQVACQQTCPTHAIVFGDINDPKSRVSKLRADPRAFRVLESLNTKPSVSYLSRVRNANVEEGPSHG